MKKVLFSAIALTAFILTGCAWMSGKKGYIALNDECEAKCNKQGKRVDYQYSEGEAGCKCSTALRGT